jgi:uncharacterized protein (TIGR02270 family)
MVAESSVADSRVPKGLAIEQITIAHCEEAAALAARRIPLVAAPHVALSALSRYDQRLAAHLDGLSVSGDQGWIHCEMALETPSAGTMFTAAVRAIEEREQQRIHRCLAVAMAIPECRGGLTSAFGWLPREQLQGLVAKLLVSQQPFRRLIGVAACALHRLDPGLITARRIHDESSPVRARALRTAGEIGCEDAVHACVAAIRDDDPECALWAARSSVLLGNRGTALEILTGVGLDTGPHRLKAFRLALQAMSASAAHDVLRQLAADAGQLRWLIQGSGIAGDSVYVPWLIKHMADEKTARLAGEAFSLITGADLGQSGLEGKQPEGFESGPNDDPDDPNVDMDPDDGLPWPDAERVERWWAANGSRFQQGTRYFMGAPVSRAHCIDVLKNGYQRQRILTAHYLCLLDPGTPLFNTSAPAWRQQRLLAKLS